MLHLSVPSLETQKILQLLEAASALPEGARVQADPNDESRRLIPFTEAIPDQILSQYPTIDVQITPPTPRSYREHLFDTLSEDIVESTEWPTRHEFVGDLILIKLDDSQRQYSNEIGTALLQQHPRVRAVFEDRGVSGTFRVRDLHPMAVRDGQNPTTRTQIVEGGHKLWTDPSTVYYSSRLSHEREGTLDCAKKLREELNRPLSICDPYAGVGPSLMPLISEPSLVGDLFAGDLNPDAVDFLRENISHPKATIECIDARLLKERPQMRERFDLLLVNIPHDSLEHLPSLTPLLRPNALVRGWAVIEDVEFQTAQSHLRSILGPQATIEIRRSYSATANLCRFEARNAS